MALSVLGTLFGLGLAAVGASAISRAAPKYLVSLSASDALGMAAAALVFAMLAGLAPARYLDKLDPASAYRR